MEKQTQRIDLWTWGEGRRGWDVERVIRKLTLSRKQGLCINLEGWEGEGDGREVKKIYMYIYGWFMLRFDRKQQNSAKQLSFNKKKIKKKKEKSWERKLSVNKMNLPNAYSMTLMYISTLKEYFCHGPFFTLCVIYLCISWRSTCL